MVNAMIVGNLWETGRGSDAVGSAPARSAAYPQDTWDATANDDKSWAPGAWECSLCKYGNAPDTSESSTASLVGIIGVRN